LFVVHHNRLKPCHTPPIEHTLTSMVSVQLQSELQHRTVLYSDVTAGCYSVKAGYTSITNPSMSSVSAHSNTMTVFTINLVMTQDLGVHYGWDYLFCLSVTTLSFVIFCFNYLHVCFHSMTLITAQD